ncbi:hypothetical protein FACS1894199_17440 [Bacteroidia bacterium]|nr:hypothetical protein FACS1894199_17440 [Bacteroidia bacterium]
MKYIYSFLFVALITINLSAQMSIEEINHRLETRPYFRLGLNYDMNIVLPDSVQEKFAKALNREIPERVFDSLTAFTPEYKEQTLRNIIRDCREDTLCVQEQYQKHLQQHREKYSRMYATDIMPTILILTASNWQVKRAIPILEKAIGDTKYDQLSVLMALAKLGNDSIKQVLIERYTLPYVLSTTQADTIDDNSNLQGVSISGLASDGVKLAMYLQSKEMLLNILDLIYIRGREEYCIGDDYCYTPLCVVYFMDEYNNYIYFHNFPNYGIFKKICYDYAWSIRPLDGKKRSKKEKKELQRLLSTEYRTKIKMQLREWIIANVNFE